MSIKKQQVHNALTHVIHPALGKDLITLDMIRDLVVHDKFITFTIELAEENPKIEAKVRDLCKNAIHRYVADDAVLDIQTNVNPFRQKEVENREVEEIENGANPMNMSAPSADDYTPPATIDPVPYEEMPGLLQQFMDEHETYKEEIDRFEEELLRFKKEKWVMDQKINEVFGHFFNFVDEKILDHNRREEETLFPLLQQRLMETGEHSQFNKYMPGGEESRTAVDMMEDDHTKIIQMSTLTFNFLGLAPRLPDVRSQSMVSDLAFEQGQQLIELLRLHVERENKTLFPLACRLISDEEFGQMSMETAMA